MKSREARRRESLYWISGLISTLAVLFFIGSIGDAHAAMDSTTLDRRPLVIAHEWSGREIHLTWNGTSVTTTPGLNSSARRSHTAVWLCRKLCHQLRGTNCGTTTVMSSYGCRCSATSSM